ncbi:heat shock protein HtpX [Halobiforma haloterrestris]|uniref:Heat shock protein HtpX n=1 Tax=Natronobacterium haloterrestre TaxID=148448 RepID=A0A1I1JGS8_NATHA|nr:M48 family metalloprotease [Halobiforma haloterrestris]SFC45153.1 heat shock protein HtpX [Halobiforma haloterrestris]
MALTPDRRLRVRIAGALALVVAINGLLLSVLVWSAYWALSASGHGETLEFALPGRLPLFVGSILLGAIGLVAVQARYGTRTVTDGLGLEDVGGDDDGPRNVAARVRRLAAQADVPIPSVAVADREEPGCLTVGPQRSPTIVVTMGLLETLDDRELDAALAHEIAHVANRDLPVVTAVAATVAIGDRLLERERKLRSVLWGLTLVAFFTGVGLLLLAVPIVALSLVYIAVSVVARALLGVNAVALGLFSKTREYAADRGASRLTGDPAALASALEALEGVRPERDARLHATATLGIVPQPLSLERSTVDGDRTWFDRWFVDQFAVESDDTRSTGTPGYVDRAVDRVGAWLRTRVVDPVTTRFRQLLGWRPSTHPPTDSRVDRLRDLERRRRN